jgi:hypothetical protein
MIMFDTVEQNLILQVKNRIQCYISSCVLSPWGLNSYLPGEIINWQRIYLTGGAIASLLQGEEPKDWDFYFKDELTMTLWKNALLKPDVVKYVAEAKDYYSTLIEGKMVTANSITMNNHASFITMIYGEPKDVRTTFDFVHCTPWYDVETAKLYISRQMYDSIVQKKLIVNNITNCKPWRVDKFKKRGYDAKEVSNIC